MFDKSKYRILNEFYRNGLKKGVRVNISSGSSDRHDYVLPVIPQSDEIFVSIGYFDTPDEQMSLILLWMKVADRWLLYNISAGVLMVGHKEMMDWFDEARQHYERGKICDAGLKMMVVDHLLNKQLLPLINIHEQEVKSEAREMVSVFRKQLVFPREVEIIASRPSILQVSPFVLGDTLFPMIQYLSGIDVQDSIALNRECDSLHRVLGQIYEGIDKNNKKIIYLPFDKIPQTNQTRPLHKFYRSFE